MPLRTLIVAALVMCAALAAPAQAKFAVGMSDQNPRMFDDANFQSLNVQKVRYIVPWDWHKDQAQENEVITYMDRAEAAGAEVLVHFSARRGCYRNDVYSRAKACKAPSVKKYRAAVQRFLRDFPQTTTIGVWNEANHRSQPISKNPKLAAKYFLAARDVCRGCKIVAIDLLDQTNMVSYLQGFDRFDKGKASIYGLHNYGDVNRNRALYTRQLLSRVGGEVWATETGGIMTFKPNFPRNPKRQANRTKYMFKLGAKYDSRQPGMRSSITRIYNYQWTGAPKGSRFDAGLVDPDFSPRPAFKVFKKKARAQGR